MTGAANFQESQHFPEPVTVDPYSSWHATRSPGKKDITLSDCRPAPIVSKQSASYEGPVIRAPKKGEKYELTGQRDEFDCVVEEHFDGLGNLIGQSFYPVSKATEHNWDFSIHRVLFSACRSTDSPPFIKPEVLGKVLWQGFEDKLALEFSNRIVSHPADLPNLRIHDLRHQFASHLVNSGRSLYEVQQILGHSDPSVTQRYAHLSTRMLQEAAETGSVGLGDAQA